jgi:hypothetical protein
MHQITRRKFIRDFSLAAISVTPVVGFLSSCSSGSPKAKKIDEDDIKKLVNCAFRLTDQYDFLNLEFYFINCKRVGNKVIATYGQAENYMIVRLPQQHIAEQSFPIDDSFTVTAESKIAGYSYLVFRILFEKCKCQTINGVVQHNVKFTETSEINLDRKGLLDWNNEHKFRLVVRQDLADSIFNFTNIEYRTKYTTNNNDTTKNKDTAIGRRNLHPIGFDTIGNSKNDTIDNYNFNNNIKVDNDPITALEIPTGLIISPKLPDSRLYKFVWDIPNTQVNDKVKNKTYKLWTATLKIEKRKDRVEPIKNDSNDKASVELTEVISSLEAMIIGSISISGMSKQDVHFHLHNEYRNNLVDLYIQYKLLARMDKLMFSPLGASTHINLYNSKLDKTSSITLLEWDQVISFGRDEEIKTSILTMEKHFGHKMAIVETSKRQVKYGRMQLVKQSYLVPLDIEKDYTTHQTQETSSDIVTKFASPFRRIKFLEKEPKILANASDDTNGGKTGLKYQFEAEDWNGAIINFEKEIFVTKDFKQSEKSHNAYLYDAKNTKDEPNFQSIDSLNASISSKQLEVENIYSNFSNKLSPSSNATVRDYVLSNINDSNKAKDSISFDKSSFINNEINDAIFTSRDSLNKHIRELRSLYKNQPYLVDKLFAFYEIKTNGLKESLENDAKRILAIEKELYTQKAELKKIKDSIEGYISLKRDKICYTVTEAKTKVENEINYDITEGNNIINDKLSHLRTDYIVFSGNPMPQNFDFFNEFAIIPKLKLAQVYVPAISDLVNQELPITIEYAEDYLKNQLETAKLEVQKNVSQVFLKLTQTAQESVQKAIDSIASETAGFNLSMPGEYLTFLKNPQQQISEGLQQAKKELINAHPEVEQIQEGLANAKTDLILITNEVKNAMKSIEDLKNMDPRVFFKQFKTWFFSNFPLEELLDIGFDLPVLHKMPDKLTYNFSTNKLKEYNTSFLRFTPNYNKEKQTVLNLSVEKSLISAKKYFALTYLNNFSIGIYSGNSEILSVLFDSFKVISSYDKPKKFEVKIDEVKFGGALEFIADLAKNICMPADGLLVRPSKKGVVVEYAVPLPNIDGGVMKFKNLNLTAQVNIPFEKSDKNKIQFTFGINRPEQKFLVASGMYGGGGHFLLTASPTGIEAIDFSLEMGAYLEINLGIVKGQAYMFFGLWFITERTESNQNRLKAVAYLLCVGNATVFGFITISVRLMLALTYIKEGPTTKLFGEASVVYSVQVAFFKKSFTIHYYKEIIGAGGNDGDTKSLGPSQAGMFSFNNNQPDKKIENLFEDDNYIKKYLSAFFL